MSDTSPDLDAFVLRYIDAYNSGDIESIIAMIGDPQVRHAAGETVIHTAAQTRARIEGFYVVYSSMQFRPVVMVSRGDMVSLTWNATFTTVSSEATAGERTELSSIEVFRIEAGRIVEVWNAKESLAHFPV
ncbi:MAG: hypothetical protein RLZZ623_2673 [Actinomycetota bacterium]